MCVCVRQCKLWWKIFVDRLFFFSLTTKLKLNKKLPQETKTRMKVITLGLIMKSFFWAPACISEIIIKYAIFSWDRHIISCPVPSFRCSSSRLLSASELNLDMGESLPSELSESLVFLPAQLSERSQSLVGTHNFSHSYLYFHSHMEPNAYVNVGSRLWVSSMLDWPHFNWCWSIKICQNWPQNRSKESTLGHPQ